MRVLGDERQEHPDNEKVRRLVKAWLEKREIS
ncbi:hypothetical protein SAMN05216167_1194 [Spirosoma endophyticum]|uniref:Uncharacterized protein n=1 Tax=Spirosoma endophyticum TaxID=662367 RepID=A0A1I2D4H4_9BACT|nr:hypothetical protein SAMN05216167_1194 [Spirosoma endophyticum]